MLINNLQQDPVEFIVANEPTLKSVFLNYPNKALKILLSNHGGQINGNKDTLVQNIFADIKLGTLSLSSLQKFFYSNLEEGKRHLFVFDIFPESILQLKNIDVFNSFLEEKGLHKQNLLYQNVSDGLVLFDFLVKNDKVASIKLGYKEKKILRVPNYETNQIERAEIDYHIFININFDDNMMIINLEPFSGLIENNESDETVSIKKIALRYKEDMQQLFTLMFEDTHEITQKALYRIWEDATKHDIPQIQEILDSLTDEVGRFVNSILKKEEVNLNKDTQNKLVNKILYSIENAVITERYDDFKEQIEQDRNTKLGYITEQNIRERTGSTLKQKSPDRKTPIEESVAFSDTKVTIDQLERVQKLTYTWNGIEDIPPGKIPTIIESFTQYDHIIFSSHTTLEEIEHVLYRLKRYKAKVRPPRNNNREI